MLTIIKHTNTHIYPRPHAPCQHTTLNTTAVSGSQGSEIAAQTPRTQAPREEGQSGIGHCVMHSLSGFDHAPPWTNSQYCIPCRSRWRTKACLKSEKKNTRECYGKHTRTPLFPTSSHTHAVYHLTAVARTPGTASVQRLPRRSK